LEDLSDMISVCLCDPQPVVHRGLEAMLAGSTRFEFRGVCKTLEEARGLADREKPDVLILDRSFGMHAVLETVTRLRAEAKSVRIILWAATVSDVECFRALQAGARGILRKTVDAETLEECLVAVTENELWTETLHNLREATLEHPRSRPLTPREQEVANLVAKGMKNREIAESLGIATGTVKIHLMHIFEKTGIRDRFELALQGLRLATEREQARNTGYSVEQTPAAHQVK